MLNYFIDFSFYEPLVCTRSVVDGEPLEQDHDPNLAVGDRHFYSDRQFARLVGQRRAQGREQSPAQFHPESGRSVNRPVRI